MKFTLPAFLAALFLFTSPLLRGQSPLVVDDMWRLPYVSDPQIAPDGRSILYRYRQADKSSNRMQQVLIRLDRKTLRKNTLTYNANDVQWSPDGAYLTFRGEYGNSYGLFRADVVLENDGAEAILESPLQLVPLKESNHFLGHGAVKNHAWSPDGRYIAYVAADPSSCTLPESPNEPVVIDRTLFKGRTALSDGCLTRIFLTESRGGGNTKAITPGDFDSHSMSWSPDSDKIVFVSNHSGDADNNYNNDLWIVDVNDGSITQLTDTPGTEFAPQWSPNGEWIAFPATSRPVNTKDSPPENTAVTLIRPDGSDRKVIGAELDQRAANLQWSRDGEWLYFTTPNEGRYCLYRANTEGEVEEIVCKEGYAAINYSLGEEELAYTLTTFDTPTEIFAVDLDGKFNERLTFHGNTWKGGRSMASVSDFWFESFDGTRVQGFVAEPAGAADAAKLPVVHLIHGGPHGMYGYSFNFLTQLLTSAGYAVVYINPRGSSGYGQEFADGTFQAWGEGDYQDLMLGMDAGLGQFDFLDADRMGVMGGSYGGYMCNWIVTQTNRYKAAVSIASLSNLVSFYGNSLYQLLIETEFGIMPWDDYEMLWKHSPMSQVQKVSTPTLLLHGENDNDVPIEQAEEFFIALQKLDVPSRLVRYPEEGHGIRQPAHQEHYYDQILDWFGKYIPK